MKLKCLLFVVLGAFVLAGCHEEPITVDEGASTGGPKSAKESEDGLYKPNAGGVGKN